MVYKSVHKLTSLNDDVLLSYHNANYNYHVVTRRHRLLSNLKNMLLDLMWLEKKCVTEWYLYGMGCPSTASSLKLFKKYLRTIDFSYKFDMNL